MNRATFIGIISALALIVYVGEVSSSLSTPSPTESPISMTPVRDVASIPQTQVGSLPVSKSATATSSVKIAVPLKKNEQVKTVQVESSPSTQIELIAPAQTSYESSAAVLRGALVNILCFAPVGSGLRSVSGSGIIIDPKGIILTNAHIGQYFLFANRGVSCSIRTGSPAVDSYKAAPVYISPEWITKNSSAIAQDAPTGTGEYDFALLAIERSATKSSLPTLYPAISLSLASVQIGTPIVIASYGAQFLESSQIQSYLFPTVVFGSVKDVFTFASTTVDVLALGGSPAAQEGSSGGGVASAADGTLIGVITTSTVSGSTDTRKLSAITSSYIRAEYARETGKSLELLLTKPISKIIEDFVPKISPLEAILSANLSH